MGRARALSRPRGFLVTVKWKKFFRALVPAPPLCSSSVRMRKKNFSRFAPRAGASVVLHICASKEKNFFRASRLGPAPPLCSSSVRVMKKKFSALRASCLRPRCACHLSEWGNFFSRFAPRACLFVTHVICQNEVFFFFALRASCSFPRWSLVFASSSCTSSVKQRTLFFFLRFAPRARALAVQTLLMEYAFFRFSSFLFFCLRLLSNSSW